MKRFVPAILLLFVFCSVPVFAADYVLSVNGKTQEICLDREVTLKLADGTSQGLYYFRR